MKLGPVSKLDKKNKTTSKMFEDAVMSANYDVIVIFPIILPSPQKRNETKIRVSNCSGK